MAQDEVTMYTQRRKRIEGAIVIRHLSLVPISFARTPQCLQQSNADFSSTKCQHFSNWIKKLFPELNFSLSSEEYIFHRELQKIAREIVNHLFIGGNRHLYCYFKTRWTLVSHTGSTWRRTDADKSSRWNKRRNKAWEYNAWRCYVLVDYIRGDPEARHPLQARKIEERRQGEWPRAAAFAESYQYYQRSLRGVEGGRCEREEANERD